MSKENGTGKLRAQIGYNMQELSQNNPHLGSESSLKLRSHLLQNCPTGQLIKQQAESHLALRTPCPALILQLSMNLCPKVIQRYQQRKHQMRAGQRLFKSLSGSFCSGSAVTNGTSMHKDMGLIHSLIQWVSDPASPMSCGVGRRCSWGPMLLQLLCRPAAAALIRPLAWEFPYATSIALKRQKTKNKKPLSGSWGPLLNRTWQLPMPTGRRTGFRPKQQVLCKDLSPHPPFSLCSLVTALGSLAHGFKTSLASLPGI